MNNPTADIIAKVEAERKRATPAQLRSAADLARMFDASCDIETSDGTGWLSVTPADSPHTYLFSREGKLLGWEDAEGYR